MTVQELIEGTLRLCSLRISTDTQLDEALEALNGMLNLWNAERLMVYAVTKESLTLVVGTGTYTIGSGGTFDTVRPQKLLSAYIRDTNSLDYPVDVSMTENEYNSISDKTETGRPEHLYYSPEYPLGKIYFDLIPEVGETFVLDSWKQITEFASLEATITLPKEYEKALRFNLALDLAPEYGVELDKTVIQQAALSKIIIENINAPLVEPVRFGNDLTMNALT